MKTENTTFQPDTGRVEEVPLDLITPSATNRKHFTPASLAEMAASITAHGVQTPALLRPKPGGTAGDASPFELVYGERRWRGSQLAGKPTLPSLIRTLDDHQALEIQKIENLQREDLDPIDEGRGYQEMLRDFGYSVADLITKLGLDKKKRGKTYIFSLIKIANADHALHKAVRDEKISKSVAVRIARIPDATFQQECLAKVLKGSWASDNEPFNDRQTADLIAREYMRELKGAPFDQADATLVPVQTQEGVGRVMGGACADCPMRTGNMEDAPDSHSRGRGDGCTNPRCYAAKCEAARERLAEKAKAQGAQLLSEAEASRAFSGYGRSDDDLSHNSRFAKATDKPPGEKRTYAQLAKEADGLKPVLAVNPRTGKEHTLYVKTDFKAAVAGTDAGKVFEQQREEKREDNAKQIAAARAQILARNEWEFRVGALCDAPGLNTGTRAYHAALLNAMDLGESRYQFGQRLWRILTRRIPIPVIGSALRVETVLKPYLDSLAPAAIAGFNLEAALHTIKAEYQDPEPLIADLARASKIDLDAAWSAHHGRLEACRQAKQSTGFQVPHRYLAEAAKSLSADRIAQGRPVLSFELDGLHYTTVYEKPLLCFELCPVCALSEKERKESAGHAGKLPMLKDGFDSGAVASHYQGQVVSQRGVQYVLRGPALQLVDRDLKLDSSRHSEAKPDKPAKSNAPKLHATKAVTKPDSSRRSSAPAERSRKLSPASRERIAAAQRARWAMQRSKK